MDMVPATPAQRRAVRLEQAERSMEGAPVRKGDRIELDGEGTRLRAADGFKLSGGSKYPKR